MKQLKTESIHRQWKLRKHLSPRLGINCPHRIEAVSTRLPCCSPGCTPIAKGTSRQNYNLLFLFIIWPTKLEKYIKGYWRRRGSHPMHRQRKKQRITYLGSLYFLVINKIWAVKIIYLKINWLRMDEHLKGNGNNSLWGRLNKSKENSEKRSICLFVCCCKWLLIICRDFYLISGLCIIQRVVLLRFELVVSRRMTVALRNKELERKTGFFKRID